MCTIGDDIQEDERQYYIKKLDINKIKICNKCREKQSTVILHQKHGYCKECFLNGTIHKFKAFLGKHRFIKKNDQVLVNYIPGHPATSLLSFLCNATNVTTAKQLKFNPVIFYIERNYHLGTDKRLNVLEEINNHIKQFNFKIYFVSFLQYVINNEIDLKMNHTELKLDENDGNSLKMICSSRIDLTTETELYRQFEHKLLLKSAKKLGCQHIFTCDLAADVASQILTNVSLGRGSHLQMDVGICDTRDASVEIIKPLRLFDIKELALYNFYNRVNPVIVGEEKHNQYASVQNLMTHFVQNLQINFPSTITTVVKTGNKLSMDKGILNNKKCELCSLPVESRNVKLTSAEATDFSHWLSNCEWNTAMSSVDSYHEALSNFKQQHNRYCYACSRISKFLIKE